MTKMSFVEQLSKELEESSLSALAEFVKIAVTVYFVGIAVTVY